MRWLKTARLDLLLTAAAVLAVSGPLLFTHSGFAVDFTNFLWLAWVAGKELVQAGHPSYFLNASNLDIGVFYPIYSFYGGPLFMITGGISELLDGNAVFAFVGVTVLAIAASYVGMLWLGREFGLHGVTAHGSALTVITSAYYLHHESIRTRRMA